MAKLLLDTDVLVEWLRGNARVVAWIRDRDAAGDYLACSPVTIAEVYAGLRAREEFVIADLLQLLHCVEIDERAGRKAGSYLRAFNRSHGVEVADALIAASAHIHGLKLLTLNLRHYPMRDVRKQRPGE